MSRETSEWLNTQTVIGFTDKRGKAWHYREGASNHYPGAVPFEVVRSLLDIGLVSASLSATYVTENGVTTVEDDTRQAIVRSDTGQVLGVFRPGYKIHHYPEWLLNNVSSILGDTLEIGSAGLLRKGGVAWVQVEMPDSITTPEGVEHRPFLTASTSCDGTLASTYQTGTQLVVCDNTLDASHAEATERVKIKHSAKSLSRISDVRDALRMVHTVADDFNAEVKMLCETTVTEKQWDAFLVSLLGAPGEGASKNAHTIYERKRAELQTAYMRDERSAPWVGTAFGVVQAVNTWNHHTANVRGVEHRAERNMDNMVTGKAQDTDRLVKSTLQRVLETV